MGMSRKCKRVILALISCANDLFVYSHMYMSPLHTHVLPSTLSHTLKIFVWMKHELLVDRRYVFVGGVLA